MALGAGGPEALAPAEPGRSARWYWQGAIKEAAYLGPASPKGQSLVERERLSGRVEEVASTVGGQASRLAWYRFSATAHRRWGAYLGLVLIIGLVGGAGLGALAAAQRTASSYTTFMASTNPSDLSLNINEGPDISAKLSRLAGVAKVATSLFTLNAFPLSRNGRTVIPTVLAEGEVNPIAGLAGEFFSQDRVTVTQGRMASPGRQDEFVTTA
jgi:hypothetical protein